MKQKIYAMLLLLATVFTAHAADKQWCLVVESAGGETIAIALSQKPVIATQSDGYKLTYGESAAEFTWSELKKLTLEETEPTATAVKDVKNASLKLVPGEVAISGAQAGTLAQVFTVGGRQVLSERVADNGTVTLSTAGLPAGIYIIKTNKSTFKIVKK